MFKILKLNAGKPLFLIKIYILSLRVKHSILPVTDQHQDEKSFLQNYWQMIRMITKVNQSNGKCYKEGSKFSHGPQKTGHFVKSYWP